ncbi:hypothetical protein [Roseobacter sp.]|uniref:hypothetical protein n=1 Tax=Roseobacter sp. TaxID=1907202 RepID=UPI00385A43D2
MAEEVTGYYFRIRENGAVVFRVDTENRQHRVEMDKIAVVNIDSGEIKPSQNVQISDDDLAAIQRWLDQRRQLLANRHMDDIHRTIDHMNLTTQWAQSRATDAQLEKMTDEMLLAMHDLRSTLLRRKAERLSE